MDLHVSEIHFRIDFGKNFEFAPPDDGQEFSLDDFDFLLKNDRLIAYPKVHFADKDSARLAVEPFIRNWTVQVSLSFHVTKIEVSYETTKFIDRSAGPKDNLISSGELNCNATFSDDVSFIHRISHFPPPPDPEFSFTPDVESIWNRYVGYKEGREPLPAMAYFCYTVLTPHGKNSAISTLNTDEKVLKKLSELSSTRGGPTIGRKGNLPPLSQREYEWLEKAVLALLVQLAKSTAGPPHNRLTMNDLPSLHPVL